MNHNLGRLCYLAVLIVITQSLIVTIPHHKEECFYENLDEDVSVSVNFQVTAGGALDIDVTITGPDNKVIYEAYRESDGKLSFTTETEGLHKFCFSNKMSSVTEKVVNFQIVDEDTEEAKPAKPEDIHPLEKAILQLSDSLHSIQTENKYMRLRERAHRNTSESTNARVLWFSFIETIILIAMSLYQIQYFRSLFEVRKTV